MHNLAEILKKIFPVIMLAGLQFLLFPFKALCADHAIIALADPTIFYHDGTYYLYGTTGNGNQGFEVYTSTDQKNWNGPAGAKDGYALRKGDAFGESRFWAPQVFHYNNKFYMAYTAEENIAIAVSDSPLGPFTQQIKKSLFTSGSNIDPYVFIDDDGQKYLYYVVIGSGRERIFVAELEDDFSAIRSQTAKECLSASSGTWERNSSNIVEGPTVVKQGGTYFLIYSANAYQNPNYAVGYATSTSPTGSWSKYAGNPILKKEDIGINGPGHGDLYKDADGNWKYVFHTHYSNNETTPRKTAVAEAGFTNGGQQFTINGSGFYYLKRTIYFKQDFNTSTDYLTYVGKGTNQFDGLLFNGNALINTSNNKLRLIKSGGTGTNRAGVNKTTNPFNPNGVGGFLKISMEVTVSNNTANIPKGFMFSVGTMPSDIPAAPLPDRVHSDFYINPTATQGTFILRGGREDDGMSSQPLSGTQTLIWYINNSGEEVGYANPSGTISNLNDDAADVWAIGSTGGATLVLHNVPATTPAVEGLRAFKISNNDNFIATLDIDDIVISEEPVLPVSTIPLTSFSGKSFREYVDLNWSTASEQSNARFEVLRSSDGKTFAAIGTIEGTPHHIYSFTDASPLAGVNYYKLAHVNSDNLTTYSETITINSYITENDVIKIVVLGSSTAVGTGATSGAGWVSRYTDYIKGINGANEVINLAKGGYTTYHILPDGVSTPDRPDVDTDRNISKALTYSPDVIIINMPSNDVSSGYSADEVMGNYETIATLAATVNVPVYFTTTQPRNMTAEARRQRQITIKNATIDNYPDNYIDFWTGIAAQDGKIEVQYDSGDGIHLNNAGHDILYNRVVGTAGILTHARQIQPGSYSSTGKILVDFGANNGTTVSTTGNYWNNITNVTSASTALQNKTGETTPFTIKVHAPFTNINNNGTTGSGLEDYPENATKDSFYGYTTGTFTGGPSYEKSGVTLSNLDRDKYYTLKFYASRMADGATDNRESKYTVKGKTEQVVILNILNNVSNTVAVQNIEPDENGEIVIEVTASDDNTHNHKFYYLGVLDIEYKPRTQPVVLKGFTVVNNLSYIDLRWETLLETNNSHFEIYKAGSDKTFSLLETISASGDTKRGNNYTYRDYNPFDGVNYYFLRQVDIDGLYTDYDVKSVGFGTNRDIANAYIPVGTNNVIVATEGEYDGEKAEIHLLSLEGRLLANTTIELKKGKNEIEAGQLNIQGIYVVVLKKSNQLFSWKVIR